MSVVPDPPADLQCGRRALETGTKLHRLHDPRFGGAQFNPGFGSSRFAPLTLPDGSVAATLYAGTSLECAIFESIFHDLDPDAAFKSVPASHIEPLHYSVLETTASIPLVPLFTADLHSLKLRRNQLIDTPASSYGKTQAWSTALADAAPEAAGLLWVSRQYDEQQALMLIEQRLPPDTLSVASTVRIGSDLASYQIVQELARRAGITITL